MSQLLPLVVVLPLLGAALLVAVGRLLPRIAADGIAAAVAVATTALAVLLLAHASPGASEWVGGWEPGGDGKSVGIVLVGDAPGTGLAALVSLLTVSVLAYSWRYFDEVPQGRAGAFPALVLLFQAGMCGFALTGDLFNAFVFFELMSVVAYALTGYRVEEPKAVQGALTFGVVNSLGAYATLMGIAMLYARTGELGMRQIGDALRTGEPADALVLGAFVLVMTGLLVKAAAVPFHFWLPDAHAVAPTPVCMLLSGVMVELGVYGVWRVYTVVFAGPGGLPAADFTRCLVVLGAATALLGAALCWRQRHLKRMLAYSTIAHTGLFLVGIGLLRPESTAGVALYVLGHAGTKAALFACTGILLDRYGSVDERELHGKGRELPVVAVLYGMAAFALTGLPPFGTALGKGVAEEASGAATVLFLAVSVVTGAAVMRAGARVFLGAGPQPDRSRSPDSTSGDEEPETREPLGRRVPLPMVAVPAALLAGALAVGLVPALAAGAGRAFAGPEAPAPHWTPAALLTGALATACAAGCAALAVRRAAPGEPSAWTATLLRLHSGHIGDYVAWFVLGTAVLGALALPGVVGTGP
ncbi:proton-conducting transporter membrane subunit [Streptomyces sp. NPDC046853]|uniref:complex I subunit 5 family protein n=1 Tax=Streptomyces sp. NPDC046853 TaxID=3154920 RepID=UPI0033DAE2CD